MKKKQRDVNEEIILSAWSLYEKIINDPDIAEVEIEITGFDEIRPNPCHSRESVDHNQPKCHNCGSIDFIPAGTCPTCAVCGESQGSCG